MKIDIPEGYTNDFEFECEQCGAKGMCFIDEDRSTEFCPCCACRNIN